MLDPPTESTIRAEINALWQKSGMEARQLDRLLAEVSVVVMRAILEGKQVAVIHGARIAQTSDGNVVLVDMTGDTISVEELKIT